MATAVADDHTPDYHYHYTWNYDDYYYDDEGTWRKKKEKGTNNYKTREQDIDNGKKEELIKEELKDKFKEYESLKDVSINRGKRLGKGLTEIIGVQWNH